MVANALLLAILSLTPAFAHVGLLHPSAYGWPANNAEDKIVKFGGITPLRHLPFSEWWFQGNIHHPPPEGVFMELPSGGTFIGELGCLPKYTSYGVPGHKDPRFPTRACHPNPHDPHKQQSGALHSSDKMSTPRDKVKDVKGTALAIAYESDPKKIKPEDFVVISTNQTSPWEAVTEYKIPAHLRPCPPGGCHCLWGWIHGTHGGRTDEMYMMWYRCKVTNADPKAIPLPKPRIANKCPVDKSNCTVGAKQPHYFAQKERNNNHQHVIYDPPYYNTDYGFQDGAQTDLWKVPHDRREWRK